MIGNSYDETNFLHKLLLSDTQISRLCKDFANGSSGSFSKTQLSKIIQSGGILGELLVTLPYAAPKTEPKELIKRAQELSKDATRYFVNKGKNRLKKILQKVKVQNNSKKQWNLL